MHMDVADLRSFYRTTQGELVRRHLTAAIRRYWRDLKGLDLVCLGYGAPYARAFLEEAASVTLLMPEGQGVLAWPPGQRNMAALVKEEELPLRDESVDRLLLVHAIEPSVSLRGLMEEVFRVLKPMGEVLAIVPNRRGAWARRETTPFGTGRPFSRSQLAHLLESHGFTVEGWSHALFGLSGSGRFAMRTAGLFERTGRLLWPGFSGVVTMLATKEVLGLKVQGRAFRLLQAIPELIPTPATPSPSRREPA